MRLRNKPKVIAFASIALLMVALLVSSACAQAPPAAAEKTVKVGHIAFTTGPVADAGLPISMNAVDSFRWINERYGGVEGVKIDFKWIDSGYEAPRSVAIYQRLKEWGAKIIWSFGTVPNDAIMAMAQEDGMPIMAWGGDSSLYWPPDVFFATYMGYAEEGRFGPVWLKNNVPGLPAVPKLAMILSDDAFGWSTAHGPLFYEAEDGYEVVAHELLGHGALDATTQIRNIMKAGADMLLLHYTVGTNAVVVRDAIRLGFKGPIISTPQALDYALGPLSEGAAEADNVYWLSYTHLTEERLPAMEPIYEMLRTYYPNRDPYRPSEAKVWENGIIAPFAVTEGIRAAIKTVGYENLTQASIIKGLETLNFDSVYGLAPLKFSPDDHRGNPNFAVFQLKGGEFKLVGDFEPAPEPADWEKRGDFKWAD